MDTAAPAASQTAHRVRRLGHLDLPGAGRVVVQGNHAFLGHMDAPHGTTIVYCTWFSGGLRIVDIRDPLHPQEVAWYIPEPCGGNPSPQSNDVEVDARGLIHLVDRNCGFDILEFAGQNDI